MPRGRVSMFTAARRERILQAKRLGASDRTAAQVAGISSSTLQDWKKRGREGTKDSAYRKFLEEMEQAEAHPKERALGIIYNALEDRPDLAWKFIERREDTYAAPIAAPPPAVQPVSITLSFFETATPNSEVSIVATESDPPEPPALEAGTPRGPARSS